MNAVQQPNAHQTVYAIIEELCSGTCLPLGASGAVFGAIDELRRTGAARREVSLAEQVSVAMHRLEWAIRSNQADAQAQLRADLRELRSDWCDAPVGRH